MTCFAHESQMDALAERLGMDPIHLRLKNALRSGDPLITGQLVTGAAPMEELIRLCAGIPEPPPATHRRRFRPPWYRHPPARRARPFRFFADQRLVSVPNRDTSAFASGNAIK